MSFVCADFIRNLECGPEAFKMGVAGVGIATVIANGVSGSLVCCFLMQEKGSMHLSVKAMQLDKKYLKEVLQVVIPAGIQGMCF